MVEAVAVLQYLHSYPVGDYILRYVLRVNERQSAMMPFDQTLTVRISNEDREAAYAGWRRRWKHWDGRRDADGHTHAALIDMLFVRSSKEAGYEA